MALIKADRVKETSTSTGTGTFALAGAATGYRTFSSVCAIGDTFYYAISNQSNGEWESGLGTYSAANTLTRTTVHASSNSGNAVTFSAGTKECFLTLTARHLDRIQDNGQSTAIGSKTSVVAVNDSATLPDLDLQFADLKTLTAKYGPTPSYSRASTGTYFNVSGVLASAAVNEPRFDHVLENGAWVSKGLLIEEQRTNLHKYSENISAIYSAGNGSFSSNVTTAPDGTLTADKYSENTTTDQHAFNMNPGSLVGTHTFSLFLKEAGRYKVGFLCQTPVQYVSVNLRTLTVFETFGATATIQDVGNGWRRVTVTYNSLTNYFDNQIVLLPDSATQFAQRFYTGDGSSGVFAWGTQIEAGSFATSYIPNLSNGTTVRSADVCQITGSAFTNLWNATEGSVVAEYDRLSNPSTWSHSSWIFDANNGTASERVLVLGNSGTSSEQAYIRDNGADQVIENIGSLTQGGITSKTAIAFKLNDFAGTVNGSSIVSDSTMSVPSPTKLDIGFTTYTNQTELNGHIARLRYFRSRLDNTQLVNLSGGINTLAFKPVTGSGSVTVANEYTGINISVPNPLPITNGGTGAQTQLNAVTNLVGNPPNDGGQYTLASKKTSGTPTFYWVDGTGYAPTLDLLFAANKSLTPYAGPTPSFSRASTGSYFDASGVLRYAALNIFPYSEDANLNFLKDGCTVSSNVTASPDGKLTADKLVEGSGVTSATLYRIGSAGKILSIYAKKSERDFLFLGIDGIGGCYFNLNSGAVGSAQAGSNGQIESVGNGWYRCSLKTNSAGGIPFAACSPTDSGSGIRPSYTGNGSSGIFLWGAMFENSEYLSPYAATNGSSNAGPRFDHTYNGTSWVSRGLLVEEQRTNAFQWSEDFSNAFWTKASSSISSNSIIAPDGILSADKLIENSASTTHYVVATSQALNGTYTLSIFAKAAERSIVYLDMDDTGTGGTFLGGGYFDLANGTASARNGATVSIFSVGNGWYRCSVTATGNATATPWIGLSDQIYAGLPSYLGNGVSGIYIWGAQLELGAFPTSYIPTTSASATRSADVCQITGSDFSGFWNGTEGSVAVEYDRLAAVDSNFSSGYPRIVTAVKTSDTSRAVTLFASQSPSGEAFFVQDGTVQAWFSAGSLASANVSTKLSTGYKANDFAASLNGAAVATDASGTIPSGIDRMDIGNEYGVTRFHNGHIARLRYYNKRLPNATLQLLSDPDPTLNLQFALNKSLTPVAGPAPSFSRASTGTFFNASGVLTSASINTPRFDHVYSGGQWVSRGLLIEEQRTNSFRYSEDFSNVFWYKRNMSITANNAVAPDGTTTADKAIPTGSSPDFYFNSPFNPGSTATLSIFAKAAGYNTVRLQYDLGQSAIFDLSTATVTGINGSSTGKIENVGNGWYRLILTSTSVSSLNYPIFAIDGVSGDGSSGVFFWGAQSEAGAFATSYIPSTGNSSTTRSADVCQITGTSFNWMWNQGEGSVAVEAGTFSNSSAVSRYYYFDDTATGNQIIGAVTVDATGNSGGDYFLSFASSPSYQAFLLSQPARPSAKSAFGWKLNDFASSLNGAAVLTDLSGTIPTGINRLTLGATSGSAQMLNGHIAKLIYYPARLTNTKLRVLSGSSISSFIPSDVAGLELWLDASDLSTLYQSSGGSLATADGDPVGEWRDKSGNLRHATQMDGTKKPALKLAIKNGLSALRMDGSNDSFDLGDNFKHQSITVIAVQKITTTGVCVAFSRGGAGSYNPAVALVYNRSTPNTSATFNPSGGSQVVNVAITQNQFSIFRAMADGSTFTNTTNGTTATTAQTSALQFNTNSVTIGCMETYGLNAAGDYCELIIYSKALSASEWSSVNSYLNAKWSIY